MLLSELYDKADTCFGQDKPFVLYRKPGAEQIHLIEQQDGRLYRIEDFTERGFVMAPFHSDQDPLVLRPDQMSAAEFSPLDLPAPDNIGSLSQDPQLRINHIELVEHAVNEIEQGSLNKIVLSRPIKFRYSYLPIHAFNNLLNNHKDAFCYIWFHPLVGLWLGASPELLLSSHHSVIHTYSVAGTLAYNEGEKAQWGVKEREEQAIVTQYILDQLSILSIDAKVSGPVSYRAGKLWHLKSEIEAPVQVKVLRDIIQALHPTPAVCGFPKKQALEYILEMEQYERKFYAGYLGELNLDEPGTCMLFVNLRCMEWNKETATVYVGGGITGRSNPLSEWSETEQKSRTILDALLN